MDSAKKVQLFNLLHDARLIGAIEPRVADGAVSLRAAPWGLAELFEPGSETFDLLLADCTRAEWEAFDDQSSPQELQTFQVSGVTVLSTENEADHIVVTCVQGVLRLAFRDVRIALPSGRQVTVDELERAALLRRAQREGVWQRRDSMLRLVLGGEKDRPEFDGLYRAHLAWLARTNPLIDVDSMLDDSWFAKPGILFPWKLILDGRAAYGVEGNRTVGFALVGGERLCRASGSDADFMIWEFHIAESERRQGVGRAALALLLGKHPGRWTLDVEPNNGAAMGFWSRMLEPYGLEVVERTEPDGGRFLRHTFGTDPLFQVPPRTGR